MKAITLFIFLVSLCCGFAVTANAQTADKQGEQAVKKWRIKSERRGPVKAVEFKQTGFRQLIFKRVQVVVSWGITSYDELGQPIETISYDKKGKPDGKENYRYDDRGNQIERIASDVQGVITVRVNRRFDLKDRLIEELFYLPRNRPAANGDTTKTVLDYDDQDDKETILKYDGSGALVARSAHKYNADGTEKEGICESYTKGFSVCPDWKRVYKYDEKGRKVEQGSYEKNSDVYSVDLIYKYDERGNQIEFEMPSNMHAKEIYRRYEYKYDANEMKTERWDFKYDGRLVAKIKYDVNGNEMLRAFMRADGVLVKDFYERQYDGYENATKRVWSQKKIMPSGRPLPSSDWLNDEKSKGKPISMSKEKITYYR